MAGEGFFFFFFEAIFPCFIVFIFDLHMYCDDMLINWNRLGFFSLRSGDGLFLKCTVPCPSWCAGAGSTCQTEPDPKP